MMSPALATPRPAVLRVAIGLALVATAAVPTTAPAQQPRPATAGQQSAPEGRSRDEAAIRAAARGYQEAIARGDGETLARLWTPDGDIVDDEGRTMNGREAVGQIQPATGDAPPPALRITETNLRFITADVAIEDGTVEVLQPGAAAPLAGWFSATWVRAADGWKIAGLRESRITSPADSPRLDDLGWMVGEWRVVEEHPDRPAAADDAPQAAAADVHQQATPPQSARPPITVSVRWDANRAFLVREMRIGGADGDTPAMQITQRIGWDPLSRQIVSWAFGSDGSHGEAFWSRQDDNWVARTMAVLPDGTQTSSLNIYTYDGGDRCTWRSIPTHVGGEHAPHVAMTMIRSRPAAPPPREQTP